MVCTFFLFVLPALVMRAMYAFWGWLTGRKTEATAPADAAPNADGAPAVVKKGTCPYHVVLRFFGFKVPEKKQNAPTEPLQAEARPHAE